MREILFRAKQIDNGEWAVGDLEHNGKNIPKWVDGKEINPETVGQFTGLTDKNGKKIFEGDIVKEKDCVHNGQIQIKGKIFVVRFKKGLWIIETDEIWDFLYTNKDCEVIGNIHDNPELLEVQS